MTFSFQFYSISLFTKINSIMKTIVLENMHNDDQSSDESFSELSESHRNEDNRIRAIVEELDNENEFVISNVDYTDTLDMCISHNGNTFELRYCACIYN